MEERADRALTAPGVIIDGFVFRHGDIHFGPGSDGSSLVNCCILDGSDSLKVKGKGTSAITVEYNLFKGGRDTTINHWGNHHNVNKNIFIMIHKGINLQN